MPVTGNIGRSIWFGLTAILIVSIILALWIGQGQSTARGDATSTLFSPSSVTASVGSTAHIEIVGSGLDLVIDGVQLNVQQSSDVTISNVACEGEFEEAFRVGPIAIPGGSLMACPK
jgi:hypothetical protein